MSIRLSGAFLPPSPVCTLLVPVGPGLAPEDLLAAVDVLVRTAPAEFELDLVLAVDGATPATADVVSGMRGDVTVVDGSLSAAATQCVRPVVAVVDPAGRPDLAVLPEMLARLDRSDDPLPFVHRMGLLVCHRQALSALDDTEVSTESSGAAPLPELARALRPRSAAAEVRPTIGAEGARVPRAGTASVVVVAHAEINILTSCLLRLKRLSPGTELIVVDPGGNYRRSLELRSVQWITVVPAAGPHPYGAGVLASSGEFVVLVDPGVWVTRRWLEGLLAPLRADAAVVASGPRSNIAVGPGGRPGVAYDDVDAMEAFAEKIRRSSLGTCTPVSALPSYCLAVRRDAVLAVGGSDASIVDPELASLDLCLRLRAAGGHFVLAEGVYVHVTELPRGLGVGRWRAGGGDLERLRARHGPDADRALPGLVGAVMIVKDEEETLARALESLSGLVDDVVVCDTGSADGTPALLDAFGVRTTFFAWRDDFGAARDAALAEHNGTWGLLLDADETIECTHPGGWRRELAENSRDIVILLCRNLDSGTGGAAVDNASARLLRAGDCHWSGRIHEQMVRRDGRQVAQSGSDLARIVHDGYSVRRILDRGKVARNSTLTRLSLAEAGHTTGAAGAAGSVAVPEPGRASEPLEQIPGRAVFERGRTEFLGGNFDAAETCFRAALDQLPDRAELLRRIALCNLAMICNDKGEAQQAADFAERALGGEFAYTQAAHVLAVSRLRLGGPESKADARRILEQAMRAGRELAEPSIAKLVLSFRDEGLLFGEMPMLLGGLLLEAEEPETALDLLLPIAREHPDLFGGWSVLATALREVHEDWSERLAELAAPVPGVLEPLLARMDAESRTALLAGMARRGVAEWDIAPIDRLWRVMQPELRRMSRAGIVAAAQHHEHESPALALRLWRYAGEDVAARVGQARCLDALGQPEAAAEALAGLEPTGLEPADLLFVAALSADLGDLETSRDLMAALPESLDVGLVIPAQRIRALLAPVA
jgi:tetratricopeptide (TPR) repeat protein